MVNDPQKLAVLMQIAKLFFPNNAIGMASCYLRLKSNLDNDSFDYFVSNLGTGRYYIFTIDTVRHDTRTGRSFITNSFTDLITGAKGSGSFTIPLTLYGTGKWNEIFLLNDPPMNVMRSYLINGLSGFLVYSPRSSSYGITYVPANPTGTGGTGGTGGGGSVVIDPPIKTPEPVQITPVQTSDDLTKYLIPAAVVIGIYFLIK